MSFERANELLRESPRKARELALEILGSGSDPRRWLGFSVIGSSFRSEGRFAEAEAALYLAAANRTEATECEYRLLGKLANIYRDQNEFELATRLLTRKVNLAQDPLAKAKATLDCAIVQADPAFPARDPKSVYRRVVEARRVFEESGTTAYVEAALSLELICAAEDPEFSDAGLESLLEEYVRRAQYPERSLGASQVRWLAGLVLRRLGRFEEARGELEIAASGFEEQSMPVFWAVAKLDHAALELSTGHYQKAAEICGLIFPVLKAFRQDRHAWVAIRALIEASSRVALTHMHLARARKVLLASTRISRPDR